MKNFKIVLLLSTICISGLLYQCKSEQIEVVKAPSLEMPKLKAMDEIAPGSNVVFDKYLSTTDFSSFISAYHFKPATYYRLTMDNGNEFYAVQIKPLNNLQTIKDYYLVIYPDGDGYKTLVFEQKIGEEMVNVSIFDTKDYSYIIGRDIPIEYNSEESKASDRSCYNDNTSFLGCYLCGFNELTSDPISGIGCALVWWACDAAITLHCLGISQIITVQNDK